ncbi:MAG: A/G-specific adenine glycosylase [Thermodesulfobacteriota bacterium]
MRTRRSTTTCSVRCSKKIKGKGRITKPDVGRAGRFPAARFSASLLRWFRKAARKMEWRETSDPYRIWVSEIMLQQTRADTVAGYYSRFLARFPDVKSLASAKVDDVLSAWEGLGYYARARNLHKAAGIVAGRFGGTLPAAAEVLASLPGIGRSTAGAIASIAFGRDEPILDANVRRVVARLFAVRGSLRTASAEKWLWRYSSSLIAKGKGRETALALMDLGAGVCLPASPRCPVCPVRAFCAAFRDGIQGEIPSRPPRRAVPHHDIVAALIRRDGGYFLLRRPEDGLLGGLWSFPSGRRLPGESLEAALRRAIREKLGLRIAIQGEAGTVRHAYSHFRITLHGFFCTVIRGKLPSGEGTCWLAQGSASGPAMPAADRKLMESRCTPRDGRL